jgi:hypothetical protein
MLAHEYGWAKTEILEHVYFDEGEDKMEPVREIVLDEMEVKAIIALYTKHFDTKTGDWVHETD